MKSNKELKEINIKIHMYYCFDDITKVKVLDYQKLF